MKDTINITLEGFDTLFTVDFEVINEYEEQLLGGAMRLVKVEYPKVTGVFLHDEYSAKEVIQSQNYGTRLRQLNHTEVTEHFESMGLMGKLVSYIEENVELCK